MEAEQPAVGEVRPHLDRLRGRLFELVEATGMPDTQQEAFKKLIRRLTYDAQSDLERLIRDARRPL